MAFTTGTALRLLIKQVNYKAQPSEILIKFNKSVGVNIATQGFSVAINNENFVIVKPKLLSADRSIKVYNIIIMIF